MSKMLYSVRRMKIAVNIFVLFLTFNLISCKGHAQETETKRSSSEFDFSKIKKYRETKFSGQIINDYDSIFSFSQKNELSDIIYDYNVETTRQIVVVTIDDISPYTNIQKYATDLSNYWGVGDAKKNNGLTILMCKSCHQITIVAGTGTELILTDEICKEVIEKTIIPEFKRGDYYTGIKNGIIELIAKWE